MKTSHALWETSSSGQSPHSNASVVFLLFRYLLSCHWTPLRRACLHLLFTLLQSIYINGTIPWSLLFCKVNNPSSQTFLIREVTSPSAMALHWTPFCKFMSFLPGGVQNWAQNSRCVSPELSKEGRTPLIWWEGSFFYRPKGHCSLL